MESHKKSFGFTTLPEAPVRTLVPGRKNYKALSVPFLRLNSQIYSTVDFASPPPLEMRLLLSTPAPQHSVMDKYLVNSLTS
jgi:hypothetical protein